jgi:hypothetical protein
LKKWIGSILFAVSSLASAAPAMAEATDVGRQNLHHGEITAIDHGEKSFTIETRTGPEQFTLWSGAQILGPEERTSFDSLAVGEYVAVRSMQDDAERWLARSIEVIDPNELEGQLEDYPAFDVADTVTFRALDSEGDTLLVETSEGPRSYLVSDETRVVRGGKDAPVTSLRAEERVVVSAEETRPGQFTAKTITVVRGAPAAPDRVERAPEAR